MPRALLIILSLLLVGPLAAESHKPPRLPAEIDGQPLAERFAGRLVYLPQERLATQRLLRRWNAQERARGGPRVVPGLAEIYGPTADAAFAGWGIPAGRAFYTDHPELLDPEDPRYGDPGFPRFDLWQSEIMPGVYVMVLPGEDLRGPLQAFIDELWLIGHQKPPRPTVSRPGGLTELWRSSGLMQLGWKNYIMILGVGFLLLYLGIVKGFEPLLLVPMAVGCILVNATGAHMADPPGSETAGILGYFYEYGIGSGIFPLLIFLGVGALTDFGPLLANPWSALLGGAAQFGIFGTFFLAILISGVLPEGVGFSMEEAAALAIIGGADGPTSIFVAARLAPQLLGAIAVAAYSYMALVPILQPPVMRLLTNDDERKVMMQQRKEVSRTARVLFPVATILLCILFLPAAVPLIGMLMFGNLLRECRVTERLLKAAQNELINLVTIGLGLSVGTKLAADAFLDPKTLLILVLGCAAFMVGTGAGVLLGKLMHRLTGGRINPLIGAAGVSAVPMAARVVQVEGQRYNRRNFLLMHAMGPNVAGVIGSATAAGILLACFGN